MAGHLTNAALFGVTGATREELEIAARELAAKQKKSEFALTYAIKETNWNAPKYIVDGVRWLAAEPVIVPDPALAVAAAAALAPAQGGAPGSAAGGGA